MELVIGLGGILFMLFIINSIKERTKETYGTIMTDIVEYKSPLGIFGSVADTLFLKKYMSEFIATRATELKRIAEKRV